MSEDDDDPIRTSGELLLFAAAIGLAAGVGVLMRAFWAPLLVIERLRKQF